MWEELSKKIIIKEYVDPSEINFSYGDIVGSIRTFSIVVYEKIQEPTNYTEDYDYISYISDKERYGPIRCNFDKHGNVTGRFKVIKKLQYTLDIKEDSYKLVARKIVNEIAKENCEQLYYDVISTVQNEFGEYSTIIKHNITKKYAPKI